MSEPFNPYAERHKNLRGPGDARPTALEIIQDDSLVDKWSDKVVLITGATSGIGIETARALHATGAHLFITARNAQKAQKAVDDIHKTSQGRGQIDVINMDLEDLSSVKAAAGEFLRKSPKLNVLVNNAGMMASPQGKTVDGFERQFGVNHLAHFALTVMLLPTLISSSSPAFRSRVVNVSSSSHRFSSVEFDDVNLTSTYDPFKAYGQSKTATIWTANYIDRIYGPRGVHALSVHPGGIWTDLLKYVDSNQVDKWKASPDIEPLMKSPAQGAATTVWAASAKVWEGKGGKYLAECTIAPPTKDLTSTLDSSFGPHAYNEEGENRLWELSCKLTGVKAP